MWRKRDLIIASVVIVALISTSVGFYELGLNHGKDIGYQYGFSQGSRSILIESHSGGDHMVHHIQVLCLCNWPEGHSAQDHGHVK